MQQKRIAMQIIIFVYYTHVDGLLHRTLETIVLGKFLKKYISLSQEAIRVLSLIRGSRTTSGSQVIYVRARHQE